MKISGKRSLEGYKIFPFIAWGLVIGFALFVYNLNTEIQKATEQLRTQSKSFEKPITNTDIENLDFDAHTNNQDRPGI